MVVMVGTTFVLAQRVWPQHADFRALAKVIGWAVALFVVSRSLPELPLLVLIPAKGLLVVALVALGLWSGAVAQGDVRTAWALVADRLRHARARPAPRTQGASVPETESVGESR
jgi:hypothetical protein